MIYRIYNVHVFGAKSNVFPHVQAERNTAEVYVDLAVSVGGAAWALRVLRESSVSENKDLQESFTSALTEIKLREIRAVIESCRKYVVAKVKLI